jgi:hypothetical protein
VVDLPTQRPRFSGQARLGRLRGSVDRAPEQLQRAMEKLGNTVDRMLEETGMTEEELAELFELRRSPPE